MGMSHEFMFCISTFRTKMDLIAFRKCFLLSLYNTDERDITGFLVCYLKIQFIIFTVNNNFMPLGF